MSLFGLFEGGGESWINVSMACTFLVVCESKIRLCAYLAHPLFLVITGLIFTYVNVMFFHLIESLCFTLQTPVLAS